MSDDRRFDKPEGKCPFRYAEELRGIADGIVCAAEIERDTAKRSEYLIEAEAMREAARRCTHGLTCEHRGRVNGP